MAGLRVGEGVGVRAVGSMRVRLRVGFWVRGQVGAKINVVLRLRLRLRLRVRVRVVRVVAKCTWAPVGSHPCPACIAGKAA